MNHYELLCVLPGTLSEEEVAPTMEKIQATLQEGEVEKIQVHDLGKNRLSYPMKHIRYGYYRIVRFEAEPTAIPAIQAKLRLISGPLRTLIQRYNPETDAAVITHVAETQKKGSGSKQQQGADLTLPEMAQAPVAKKKPAKAKEEQEEKVSMENIDKKLDEILDKDIANV